MDEASWEAGVRLNQNESLSGFDIEQEPTVIPSLAVSAEINALAPPFARTCQAAHLMSRIIRHTNETRPDPHSWYQEALQLHDILEAFTAAVTHELEQISQDPSSSGRFTTLLPSIGLCYSAQMNLYDTHTCADVDDASGVGIPEQLEIQRMALNSIKNVCFSVSDLATKINRIVYSNEGTMLTPLVTDCLYQAAKYILWYVQETNKVELMTLVKEIKDTLSYISETWLVASKYVIGTSRSITNCPDEYLEILAGDDLRPNSNRPM